MKKEVPCASGKNCPNCWHNDTCRLYLHRKKQQLVPNNPPTNENPKLKTEDKKN